MRNNNILLILKTYLIVLVIFSAFRCILYFTELNRIDFEEVATWTIIQSFIMGIRFDIVISRYILFIPAVILLMEEIINLRNRIIYKIIFDHFF